MSSSKVTSKSKMAIKSGFWYTVSNFFTRAIVFVTTPIFARILSVEEFGKFHVYANWQSILLIVCSLELALTVNRARLDYNDNELKNYLANCILLNIIITSIVFAIVELIPCFRDKILMLDNSYVLVMFLYLFFSPAFELFQAEQRVKYRYRLSAILSFLSVFSGASMALIGSLYFEDRLLGRIIGQYFPVTVVGSLFFVKYLSKIKKIDFENWKYGLFISGPLIFSYLGSQILTSSDKIVVQHMSSAKNVAFVGIVTTCSHIMTILVQSFNNAWAPWLYDKLEDHDFSTIKNAFKKYCWFVYICTFGVVLIGPELLLVLGDEKYAEAIWIVPPSISFCIFNLLIFQFINIETYYKKTKFAAISTAIIASLNILLDIAFVNLLGYTAVSFVTVFCYGVLMFLHYFYVRKIDSSNVVNIKNVIEAVIAVLVINVISFLSFSWLMLRMVLIISLASIGFGLFYDVLKTTIILRKMNDINEQ